MFVADFAHITVSEKPGSDEKIYGGGNLINTLHGFCIIFYLPLQSDQNRSLSFLVFPWLSHVFVFWCNFYCLLTSFWRMNFWRHFS
jgi:hypothetical protein